MSPIVSWFEMDYLGRLRRAREEMGKRGIGLMFLTYGANFWYLAGFHRRRVELTDSNTYGDYVSGAYIGTDDRIVLIAPRMGGSFYQQEAADKPWISEVRILDESESPKDVMGQVVRSFRVGRRGVSIDDRAWAHTSLLFREILPRSPRSIASEIVAPMRMIKDEDEVAAMKKAGEMADEVYGEVLDFLKVGVTEYDVAHEVDYQFVKHGAEGSSFVTGIRFAGAARPSQFPGGARTTVRRLERGDSITFDFGALLNGYCSDFGRTCFVGNPPAEFVKIHDKVMEAQAAAIKAMVSRRITAEQLDVVARSIIEKAGYGPNFVHRLGHGIGVTVHEPPFLYRPDNSLLVSGMTFTVEPSIRLPESYGARVEDVVMVTDKGGIPFSDYSKELTIIK
jgi:Xaa-Pro aminopeptidase